MASSNILKKLADVFVFNSRDDEKAIGSVHDFFEICFHGEFIPHYELTIIAYNQLYSLYLRPLPLNNFITDF